MESFLSKHLQGAAASPTLYPDLSLVSSLTDSSNFSRSFLECAPVLVSSLGHLIDISFRFRYIMSGIAALLAITQLSIFWIGQVPFSDQGSQTLTFSERATHLFCIFQKNLFLVELPGPCCLCLAHLLPLSGSLLYNTNSGPIRFNLFLNIDQTFP